MFASLKMIEAKGSESMETIRDTGPGVFTIALFEYFFHKYTKDALSEDKNNDEIFDIEPAEDEMNCKDHCFEKVSESHHRNTRPSTSGDLRCINLDRSRLLIINDMNDVRQYFGDSGISDMSGLTDYHRHCDDILLRSTVIFPFTTFNAIPNTVSIPVGDLDSLNLMKEQYLTCDSLLVHWWQRSWL